MKTLSRSFLSFAIAIATATSAASADEVRLDDGRVLIGKVVVKKVDGKEMLEVTTYDGVVVVPRDTAEWIPDDQLRIKLADRARTAGSTAFAHLQLAIDARAYGLEPELWRHLGRAITLQSEAGTGTVGKDGAAVDAPAADPQAAAARESLQRRIEDFLAQLEPELLPRKWRSAGTKVRVHKLLEQLRAEDPPAQAAAIEELLVREPNADADLRTEARANTNERRRIAALSALLRRAGPGNEPFVLRTTIVDGHGAVRQAAADLIRDRGRATDAAIHYLAPGLMHSNAKVRVRTAEAFAALGNAEAVKVLVLAGPNAGKALAAADQGVRGHVAFLNQQAYIRDFDVEVASAAFIADPKVDVLQSGTVLDVTVAGVFEERVIVRAYHQALKKLARSDPGADPRAWPTWLANLQPAPPVPAPTTPAKGR